MKLIGDDIVERISKDDKSAFEEMFRTYYTEMCQYCLRFVRDEIVAEEVVQEIFLNIWDRRSTLSINSSVKAYLYTSVKNRSFNYIKLQLPKEQKKVDVEDVSISEQISDSIEEDIVNNELHAYVRAAIDNLPPKCKVIFNLSRDSGMTYKEIAEELDLSVKTVENQVGVALKKLRTQLQPIWDKVLLLIILFI